MSDWNVKLYCKFELERTIAARDLVAHVLQIAPKVIYDLGCGPGNSTKLLSQHFPDATIVGVDNSDNMLIFARDRVPDVTFIKSDIETWRPSQTPDIIFANASLHFVTEHRQLLLRLVSYLQPKGCLAVQMPNNMHEGSYAAIRMLAADEPWADRLLSIAKSRPIISLPDEYYELLAPVCQNLRIWQTTYVHALNGPEEIIEWFRGSELGPFLDLLDIEEQGDFLARYKALLASDYSQQSDGKILFRYPRLFLVLQK